MQLYLIFGGELRYLSELQITNSLPSNTVRRCKRRKLVSTNKKRLQLYLHAATWTLFQNQQVAIATAEGQTKTGRIQRQENSDDDSAERNMTFKQ